MSAPSRSSIERRSSAEASAGEGNDPGLRRGKSEPRSSADDSVGDGKPDGESAFSRVGVARVTIVGAAAADRLDAEKEGEPARSEGAFDLLIMQGVAELDELDDAIIAERLLLRAAAIVVSLLREKLETERSRSSTPVRACVCEREDEEKTARGSSKDEK